MSKVLKIELTEEQAIAAQLGLDLFMRLSMGQFEQVTQIAQEGYIQKKVNLGESESATCDDVVYLQAIMNQAKEVFGHEESSSFGIRNSNVCEPAKRCYEVNATLGKALEQLRDGREGVVTPIMHRILVAEPLPVAEVIEKSE